MAMKTTGCVLAFLLGACSWPAPTENATDRAVPAAEAPDSVDGGSPAVDCPSITVDAGTGLYQGRRIPSVMLTRRGCSLMIDYQIK
jgi:hypothetical protein